MRLRINGLENRESHREIVALSHENAEHTHRGPWEPLKNKRMIAKVGWLVGWLVGETW